jgi:hypothetical protein
MDKAACLVRLPKGLRKPGMTTLTEGLNPMENEIHLFEVKFTHSKVRSDLMALQCQDGQKLNERLSTYYLFQNFNG